MSNSDRTVENAVMGQHIMRLIGMMPYDVQFPDKHEKLKAIMKFFDGRSIEDVTYHIMKIMDKRRAAIMNGYDSLDMMWEWVNLKTEEQRTIENLSPEYFTADIAEELSQKFLTDKSIQKIKEDLTKPDKTEELKQVLFERDKNETLEQISADLNRIEIIKKQLEIYE